MSIKVVGIQNFLNTPGWLADRVVFSGKDIQVELHRDRRLALRCPVCGNSMTPSRTQSHRVRDIGLGPDCPMWLIYTSTQGRCRPCRRYHTEHPPGVDGVTTLRFHEFDATLAVVQVVPPRRLRRHAMIDGRDVSAAGAHRRDDALDHRIDRPRQWQMT
jgi:hypothetical protein